MIRSIIRTPFGRQNRALAMCVAGALVLTLGAAAQASSVFGDPATLTGTRSVGSGLVLGTGSDSDWANGSVTWTITPSGDALHYQYDFQNFTGHDISHIVMNLSKDALDGKTLADPDALYDVNVSAGSYKLEFNEGKFNNEPGMASGVKFDDLSPAGGDFTLSFLSNRSPVWGNITIEQGQGKAGKKGKKGKKGNNPYNLVVNAALGNKGAVNNDPLNFVARPNGAMATIPSPAAAGAGFLLLGTLALKRRRQPTH